MTSPLTKEARANAAEGPCYRLIYRSHSLLPGQGMDETGLATILKQARARNADLGITGALMLYDGWFAQVLEGPQVAVETLFAKIKVDTRHDKRASGGVGTGNQTSVQQMGDGHGGRTS